MRLKTLYLPYIFWAVPVWAFIQGPQYSFPSALVWWAALLSGSACFITRRAVLVNIPLFALLSPLAINGRIGTLIPSEIFVLCLGCYLSARTLMQDNARLRLFKYDGLLLILFFLVLVSYFFAYDFMAISKSLLSWLCIMVIFFTMRVMLNKWEDIEIFFDSLVFTSVLCGSLILAAFFSGMSLSSFMSGVSAEYYNADELGWFFRASFFYANISFIIGPSTLIALYRSWVADSRVKKLVYLSLAIFFICGLLLMAEKTGLAALVLGIIAMGLVGVRSELARGNSLFSASGLVVFSILGMSLLFIYGAISNFKNYSLDLYSLKERFCVFGSTINVFNDNAERVLMGFGPDASMLMSNKITDSAKTNCGGGVEGAIDSAYMSFIFDYGFVFGLLFLLFLGLSISSVATVACRFAKQGARHVLVPLSGILVFIVAACISDVLGTGKVAWLVIGMLSIVGVADDFRRGALGGVLGARDSPR